MSRKNAKPKAATVAVTLEDVRIMSRSTVASTPAELKAAAKARAAGRELFMLCRSTTDALAALVSGVPRSEVEKFCRDYMKA